MKNIINLTICALFAFTCVGVQLSAKDSVGDKLDKFIDKTEKSTENFKDKIKEIAKDTKEKIKDAKDKAKDKIKDLVKDTKDKSKETTTIFLPQLFLSTFRLHALLQL